MLMNAINENDLQDSNELKENGYKSTDEIKENLTQKIIDSTPLEILKIQSLLLKNRKLSLQCDRDNMMPYIKSVLSQKDQRIQSYIFQTYDSILQSLQQVSTHLDKINLQIDEVLNNGKSSK